MTQHAAALRMDFKRVRDRVGGTSLSRCSASRQLSFNMSWPIHGTAQIVGFPVRLVGRGRIVAIAYFAIPK